jgi:hypothetical protein
MGALVALAMAAQRLVGQVQGAWWVFLTSMQVRVFQEQLLEVSRNGLQNHSR